MEFFLFYVRNIGYTSGVIYEAFDPERITIVLSFESISDGPKNEEKQAIKTGDNPKNEEKQGTKTGDKRIGQMQKEFIIEYTTRNIEVNCKEIAELLDVSASRARAVLTELVREEILFTKGSNRNRTYKLKA